MSKEIDLSLIPAPDAVESLNFETILQNRLANFQSKSADYTSTVESDPAYKLLEENSEREMFLRARVNDAVRATFLSTAVGADLDNFAAGYGVVRAIIDEGDPDALPPIDPTYEPDDELRRRTQLAFEGLSVAGSENSYIFHALSVAGVRDASVISPAPCEVNVYIVGRDDNGTPSAEVLAETMELLSGKDVRPLSELLTVLPPEIVEYSISAILHVDPGPAAEAVQAAAQAALEEYTSNQHKLGASIALSGIHRAAHGEGVARVELIFPAVDLVCNSDQAPYCTSINLTVQVANG